MDKEKRFSKLAILSMVSSLFFFIPIVSAIAAIILGSAALYSIGLYRDVLKGRAFAFVGISFGTLQMLLLPLLFILPYFHTADFNFLMGNLFSKMENNNQAIYYYERALSKIPKTEEHAVNGNEFGIYNNLGSVFLSNGNHKQALDAYDNGLEVAKKSLGLSYYGIGAVQGELKEFDKALESLDKAIQYNPKLAVAYQEKAADLRRTGRFEDSLLACEETKRLFPDFAQAYSTAGLAYEKLGRYEEAISSHLEAICINPRRYFPRDRLYFCFYQLEDKNVRFELLKELKLIDSILAGKIERKIEKGETPEENLSENFEDHLNLDNRKIGEGNIEDYKRILKIPINEMIELDFKTRDEIYQIRKKYVLEYPELVNELINGEYKPSEAVFGQIEDKKPWWGILGHCFYGDGEKSIEGVSEESRFIVNPFILVCIDHSNAYRINDLQLAPKAIYPKPENLIWDLDSKYTSVEYNVIDFLREARAYHYLTSKQIFSLIAYNARDLGLNYLYVSENESENITSLNNTKEPLLIPFFIHRGNSCGYPGGCNNMSPENRNFDIKIKRIPALIHIFLWRNRPNDISQHPDMIFDINIK